MSTEQMRSEFEEWWKKNNADVKTPMGILVKGIAEKAWRESRTALVVTIPSAEGFSIYSKETAQVAIYGCVEAILAAGITVREG